MAMEASAHVPAAVPSCCPRPSTAVLEAEYHPGNGGHRGARQANEIFIMSLSPFSSAGDFSAFFSFHLEIKKQKTKQKKDRKCN